MSEWMHATRVRRQQLTADCVFTREKCVHATFRRHQWHGSLSEPFNWMKGCKHLRESAKCWDLLRRSQLTQHLDVKLSFWRYEGSLVRSQVCYKVKAAREDGLCFQKHIFLSSFCPFPAAHSLLLLLLLWFFWFLPVKMRWFKTKTGPCVTSDVHLLIKLIMMQQGHTDILPPPISRTSAVVCFLLLTVASRVYTGKFPKNFDKV